MGKKSKKGKNNNAGVQNTVETAAVLPTTMNVEQNAGSSSEETQQSTEQIPSPTNSEYITESVPQTNNPTEIVEDKTLTPDSEVPSVGSNVIEKSASNDLDPNFADDEAPKTQEEEEEEKKEDIAFSAMPTPTHTTEQTQAKLFVLDTLQEESSNSSNETENSVSDDSEAQERFAPAHDKPVLVQVDRRNSTSDSSDYSENESFDKPKVSGAEKLTEHEEYVLRLLFSLSEAQDTAEIKTTKNSVIEAVVNLYLVGQGLEKLFKILEDYLDDNFISSLDKVCGLCQEHNSVKAEYSSLDPNKAMPRLYENACKTVLREEAFANLRELYKYAERLSIKDPEHAIVEKKIQAEEEKYYSYSDDKVAAKDTLLKAIINGKKEFYRENDVFRNAFIQVMLENQKIDSAPLIQAWLYENNDSDAILAKLKSYSTNAGFLNNLEAAFIEQAREFVLTQTAKAALEFNREEEEVPDQAKGLFPLSGASTQPTLQELAAMNPKNQTQLVLEEPTKTDDNSKKFSL